jgi:hypothetical protein
MCRHLRAPLPIEPAKVSTPSAAVSNRADEGVATEGRHFQSTASKLDDLARTP